MRSAQDWDQRFLSQHEGSPTPDPILDVSKKYWALIPAHADGSPRQALDAACGAGRHAVALAREGFDVTGVDFSREGMRIGEERAREQGVRVNWVQMDLEREDVDLGESRYDLVIVTHYLHRPLFPVLRRALASGGLIVYKTYTVDQLRCQGGPRHAMHLLNHNELLQAFAGFRVLVYDEQWEGKGTASLVAQKS